jgi:hypothetical protein
VLHDLFRNPISLFAIMLSLLLSVEQQQALQRLRSYLITKFSPAGLPFYWALPDLAA